MIIVAVSQAGAAGGWFLQLNAVLIELIHHLCESRCEQSISGVDYPFREG